jgi:hypothetical protein
MPMTKEKAGLEVSARLIQKKDSALGGYRNKQNANAQNAKRIVNRITALQRLLNTGTDTITITITHAQGPNASA